MPYEDDIRSLSPAALKIFKRQLPQRLKEMGELDRNTTLSRLQGMPELQELFEAPIRQPEPKQPWYQKPLEVIRSVEKGAGTLLSAPWTPSVPGTEGLPWWEREKAEYEAADLPSVGLGFNYPKWLGGEEATLGVKGALELSPWFATTLATGGLGAASRLGTHLGLKGVSTAAQAGLKGLQPLVAAERALAYPVTKPLEVITKKLFPKLPPQLVPDLQPADEVLAIAMEPSRLRNLVNVSIGGKQPLKGLGRAIAGRAATAKNPAEMSLVINDMLKFEGSGKALAAVSTLSRLGSSKEVFKLTEENLMKIGNKMVHLNDIRTNPAKYASKLNQQQKAWIDQAALLEREKRELFRRYGIEIKDLTFEEGGVYAGRRWYGKFDSENNLVETAHIGRAQPGRPGAKSAQEKHRVFDSATEATEQKFRSLPEEEALYYNMVGAYNRVANKEFTDWFLKKVPWRDTAVHGPIREARDVMLGTKTALKQMETIALKWHEGKPISGSALRGIKKHFPEEYKAIYETYKVKGKPPTVTPRATMIEQKRLADSLLSFISKQRELNQQQWKSIQKAFTDARKSAVRPGFTDTMASDIPAFAGKVFQGAEAKAWVNTIRKEIAPEFNTALNAINQVNAVGRYFALAGDVSPFGIQLLFLAGANPKAYGQAVKGFVRSFFDPAFIDNYMANNIGIIQNSPGLILPVRGATEITEAMAKGGLLRKGPLKQYGKLLEPFQRGFEASLTVAGVEMKKAYQHLGTSAARNAQVDAFINEFRGLANTQRIGISSSQRQIERATILAPQYNRAVAALMTDLFRGNLRGKLARESMARGVSAIMAMTVAVSYAMGENEDEIADHLNPLSQNFMTWDVAGQRIGPGSKVRSLLFTFGKMVKNPEDTAYHASRFLRGNFSPFLGTSMDLVTGRNYAGDPTREGLLSATQTVIGENMLPIWVQSVAFEEGDLSGRVTRGMAEFGGMRGYPSGAYGEMKALQDELAQTKYGMSWDELGDSPQHGKLYQMQLERENPELRELAKETSEESERWAHGDQIIWNEYTLRVEDINTKVNKELELISRQYEQTGDGSHFRERVNQTFLLKAQLREALLEAPEFSIVKEQFDKPLDADAISRMSPQDVAYREYNQMMYSPDMYDEFGEYRFEESDRKRTLFVQKHGMDALNYVESITDEKRVDEPVALKALRQARKILEPYWNAVDQVWKQYPPEYKQIYERWTIMQRQDPRGAKQFLFQYPEVAFAIRQINAQKKMIKVQNPEMAQALRQFYSY